jgi:hypothetical protein
MSSKDHDLIIAEIHQALNKLGGSAQYGPASRGIGVLKRSASYALDAARARIAKSIGATLSVVHWAVIQLRNYGKQRTGAEEVQSRYGLVIKRRVRRATTHSCIST